MADEGSLAENSPSFASQRKFADDKEINSVADPLH
jgi:hypothetical protein